VEVPLFDALKLTQAKIFEIGLALAVFGGSMLAISSLRGEEEQEREGA
jgi:hypothetical protein